jgi:hypothetical protein
MTGVGETTMAQKRMFPFENPGPLGVAGGLRGIHDELGVIVSHDER